MPLELRRIPDGLPRLSLNEFWSRRQIIREIEPMTEEAYRKMEEDLWRQVAADEGHNEAWHISFHGSNFPGHNPNWCPRAALYGMMNFPARDPWKRRLRISAETGKALERQMMTRWHYHGVLLTPPPNADETDSSDQLRYEYPELMMTGTVDGVLRSLYDNLRPVPVEVKSKYDEVIEAMLNGLRGPDPDHVAQCKTEIAFVRVMMERGLLWPGTDLKLPEYGVIYYMSRDDAERTAEFRIDYDPHWYEMGVKVLALAKECWDNDVLPSTPDEKERKRHPMGPGWKWSEGACQYCDYKRDICRPDHKYDVKTLTGSNGCRIAKRIRGEYDVDLVRAAVEKRWIKAQPVGAPYPITGHESL